MFLSLFGLDIGTPNRTINSQDLSGLNSKEIIPVLLLALKGSFIHTILEISGAVIALSVMVQSFVHYYIKRDSIAPAIGIAWAWSGLIDVFHTLVSNKSITCSDPLNALPLTWSISRAFNAISLLLVIALYYKNKEKSGNRLLILNILMAVIAFFLMAYNMFSSSLPRSVFKPEEFIFPRPYDLILSLPYIVILVLLYNIYKQRKDILSFSIFVSMIPAFMSQIYMGFGGSTLFNNYFNIAHILKTFQFVVPVWGFSLEYIDSYAESKETGKLKTEIEEKKLLTDKITGIIQKMFTIKEVNSGIYG